MFISYDHINIFVCLTKNDDLIFFNFNMKKLSMFSSLHITMMKISFEINKHYCFALAKIEDFYSSVHFFEY